MGKVTRKLQIIGLVLIMLIAMVSLSSCVSLLASLLGIEVEPPDSPESSLLFVELIAFTDGQSGTRDSDMVANGFSSGFFPVVVDEDGNEVSFVNIEAMTEAGLVFHHANLDPGTYTLKGFRYLWMTDYNFLNSPIKDLKFDGQRDDEFIETEFHPLPEPITLEVEPGTVASFGSYKAYYLLKESVYRQKPEMPKQDDENKMVEFGFLGINPDDTHLLEMMRDWTHSGWVEWNKRNPLK